MIRPVKHILDERPLLADLQANINRQNTIHALIIQLMPSRLKAITQIELSILITNKNCFLTSANGSLCSQLKSQQKHIQQQLRKQYPDLPTVAIRKINHKSTVSNANHKPKYWLAESAGENAINSLHCASQHISHKALAESLSRLAEQLKKNT